MIDSAKQFTAAVGDFVGQLQQLETVIDQLFAQTAPQLLDALLSNPSQFVTNFLSAAKQGFEGFFNPATLLTTLKKVAINWVSTKIPADIFLRSTDFPTELSATQIGGFALKVMGLTWDEVLAEVTTAIGPENMALLSQAYGFFQTYLTTDPPVGLLESLQPMLDDGLRDPGEQVAGAQGLLNLTPEGLKDQGLSAIQTQALEALVPAAVKWALSALNPAGVAFQKL